MCGNGGREIGNYRYILMPKLKKMQQKNVDFITFVGNLLQKNEYKTSRYVDLYRSQKQTLAIGHLLA